MMAGTQTKPRIFELQQIGQGKLYIMPAPRADSLAEDMASYMHLGIHKVVSLLEKQEVIHCGLVFEQRLCHDLGLGFEQFAIPDQGIPAKPKVFQGLVGRLYAELQAGKHLAVHCYAGIGRTGLLAGCLLVRDGMSPHAAIERMSQVRGRTMPQTQVQYEFLLGQVPLPTPAKPMQPAGFPAASQWLQRGFHRLFSNA